MVYATGMRISLSILVAVLGVIPACGSDGRTVDGPGLIDAPPGPLVVNGRVTGPGAAAGPVVILWGVDAAPVDYSYKFGDGSATATTFTTMPVMDPPLEARTRAPSVDYGVGIVTLLEPGASIPEGRLSVPGPAFVGSSFRYAIIYRGAGDTGAASTWTSAFPVGLSCGRCVGTSAGFDRFEPVDCAMLVIDTEQTGELCNWT
jgi:hypothetical protein